MQRRFSVQCIWPVQGVLFCLRLRGIRLQNMTAQVLLRRHHESEKFNADF